MSSVQSAIPKLGARNTRQRTAVIQVLNELDNFASAKAIHHELVHRDSQVGLTTVYRSCESHHHHHHLVCTSCGRTEEIDGGPVERWAQEVVANYGFQLTGHDAEVFGICAECSKKQDSASAK